VELLEAIQEIMNVASLCVQKRCLAPFAVFALVGFVDGRKNLTIICLETVWPNAAFPNAFDFFHFFSTS